MTTKKAYNQPKFLAIEVKLEQPIAATSQATITPTGPTPFRPEVEDWTTGSETQQGYLD